MATTANSTHAASMSADNIAAALTNALAAQPVGTTAASSSAGPVAPARKPPAKRGRKRAADAEAEKENAPVIEPSPQEKAIAANREKFAQIKIDWSEQINSYHWDCDVIRHKILEYLAAPGNADIATFQKAISVNHNLYERFMALSGPQRGRDMTVYDHAYRFFRAKEKLENPLGAAPTKRQRTAGGTTSNAAAPTSAAAAASSTADLAPTTTSPTPAGNPDISNIALAGEETDSVPVYDSCDEVRRKITSYLALPHVTQAQFLRDIAAQFRTHGPALKIQGKQLNDFRGKAGALDGNTSRVYYGAYVLFEKIRIAKGEGKSRHRMEMEKQWGADGVETKRTMNRVFCLEGEVPVVDEFGGIRFVQGGGARGRGKH